MSFEICYCLPAGDEHLAYAYRFIHTYFEFPPLVEHETVILTDQGNESNAEDLFSLFPKLRVVPTPDHGKDLSRYEAWCKRSSAECVMLLGGSTYCRRVGWAMRAITAFRKLGPGNLYGACGHTGAGPVRPHIRTTGFWAAPSVLATYPKWPKGHYERYHAEHGQGCISDWYRQRGGQCWVINMNSEYTLEHANDDPNGYGGRAKTHSELLIGDRLCAPPFHPHA